VESHVVAVRVGEGEGPAEGPVDRCRDDGVAVGGESVVHGLDVRGVEPDRCADAGLGNGREVGAGNDVPECECDRLRLEETACGGPACERTSRLKEALSSLRTTDTSQSMPPAAAAFAFAARSIRSNVPSTAHLRKRVCSVAHGP